MKTRRRQEMLMACFIIKKYYKNIKFKNGRIKNLKKPCKYAKKYELGRKKMKKKL